MPWQPAPTPAALPYVLPAYGQGLARGLRNRCPCCEGGPVFQPGWRGYLKVVPECAACHAPLGELRADDAPPYFTIVAVGHLLLPLLLWVETTYTPPMWLHMVVWLPLFTIASVALLRPIKGAVVGWMCALGFDTGDTAPRGDHA